MAPMGVEGKPPWHPLEELAVKSPIVALVLHHHKKGHIGLREAQFSMIEKLVDYVDGLHENLRVAQTRIAELERIEEDLKTG